jgi:hypothetical protein
MAKDLTSETIAEIRLVLERFGVSIVANLDLTDTSEVNRLLQSRRRWHLPSERPTLT